MTKKIYLKNPGRLFLAIIIIVLMAVIFTLLFQDSAKGDVIPKYETIVIAKGDTLWQIAGNYTTKNQDIRSKIDEIKELNNINADLKIGQEIKIRIN